MHLTRCRRPAHLSFSLSSLPPCFSYDATRTSPCATFICKFPIGTEKVMARKLLDLPEELLLEIMKLLHPTSIQCLRRADRVFLRLFSDRSFQHWHRDPFDFPKDSPSFSWLRGTATFESLAHDSVFRHLIRSNMAQKQCLLCQITRSENPPKKWELANKWLYCEACSMHHPAAFFSAAERQKYRDRTCIGHQGYVRICEHGSITWKEVIKAKSDLLKCDAADGKVVDLRTCRHPSHAPAHHGIGNSRADGIEPEADGTTDIQKT